MFAATNPNRMRFWDAGAALWDPAYGNAKKVDNQEK
jgi:hypothetical protein